MIGGFGELIFETNDQRILTYSGFRRDSASRFTDHEVMGMKPVSEHNGPGLDTVSFQIKLLRSFGVDPDKVLNLLYEYNREGHVYPLVIGPKTIGVDKWRITSMGEAVNAFGKGARKDYVTVELSFTEYVENQS